MDDQEDDVLFLVQAHQRRPQQGAARQVEGLIGPLLVQAQRLGSSRGIAEVADVDELQRDLRGGQDVLHRCSVNTWKTRSECLVSLDECVEALLEGPHIQLAAQLERPRQVVGRACPQVLEEPQPLLREREGQVAVSRRALDRRRSAHQTLGGTQAGDECRLAPSQLFEVLRLQFAGWCPVAQRVRFEP